MSEYYICDNCGTMLPLELVIKTGPICPYCGSEDLEPCKP